MKAQYSWPRGTENMLQIGAGASIQIILIPPLFDEANRLRKTLVDVLRGLGAAGLGAVLPDLPSTGESEIAYHDTTFDDWCAALAALATELRAEGKHVLIASFRGGALIEDAASADGIWRLAPETGTRLLRDISRMIAARSHRSGNHDMFDDAGYAFPAAFVAALEAAVPPDSANTCTVRLLQDSHPADVRIVGAPLWRRSEPEEDAVLTAAIINDISEWARSCAES